MNTEEDIQSSAVLPNSHRPHAYGTLRQAAVMSNSVSPSPPPPFSMGQVNDLSYPFANAISIENSTAKLSTKANLVESNHRSPSPTSLASSYSIRPKIPNASCPSEVPKSEPSYVDLAGDVSNDLPDQGPLDSASCGSSTDVRHFNCSVSEAEILNGSTKNNSNLFLECTNTECSSPPRDASMEINGHSDSQTPVSPIDCDRTKMDLSKLDETIDYVISNAISDDPIEGMFVLSCRARDPSHLSSPSLRANTPSSGHFASPSPSPTPPSPHSGQVTSPMVMNTAAKPHAFLTANSLNNVVAASPLSRYTVDQSTGLIQLSPCSVSSQYTPTHCNSQQTLSFLHVYQDSAKSSLPERSIAPQLNQSKTLTPTFLSSPVPGFHHSTMQNFVAHPAAATIFQNCASLASPPKLISVRAGAIQNVALIPSNSPASVATLPVDGNCVTRSIQLIGSPPASVCYVQNTLPAAAVPDFTVDRIDPQQLASFRHPILPVQPITAALSQPPVIAEGPCGPVTATTIDSGSSAGPGRKRGHGSCSSNPKRRKTSVPSIQVSNIFGATKVPHVSDQHRNTQLGEYMEQLKSADCKALVSAPLLRPYTSVLPPVGGSDCINLFPMEKDELSVLDRVGSKYFRGMFALKMPKCFITKDSAARVDHYVTQHLWPSSYACPVLRSCNNFRNETASRSVVCASPEPQTFENHMMALFSSLHQSPKASEQSGTTATRSLSTTDDQYDRSALFTSKLLPFFADATCHSDKPDSERSTPPLPLFHVPNPKLIKESSYMANGSQAPSSPVSTALFTPSCLHLDAAYASVKSVNERRAMYPVTDRSSESTPGRLQVTFTLDSSLNFGVSQLVQSVTELLGIERDAIRCQLTRSGIQVTLDLLHYSNGNLLNDLEHRIREHFSPTTFHLAVVSDRYTCSAVHSSGVSTVQATSSEESSTFTVNPIPKADCTAHRKVDAPQSVGTDLPKYPEDPVTATNLFPVHDSHERTCTNCDTLIPSHLAQHRCLEDLSTLSGLTARSNMSIDFVFCSNDCIMEYTRSLSRHRLLPSDSDLGFDGRLQTLACDLCSTIPVIIQSGPSKFSKFSKRQLAIGHTRKRRHGSGQHKPKRWFGTRWCRYSSDTPLKSETTQQDLSDDAAVMCVADSCPLRTTTAVDSRTCSLCAQTGDSTEEQLGRLLPWDVNKWIHLNCALWCFEVYETVGGSLNNVDTWIQKALGTLCSHCNLPGAGLPCYNPRCTFCYHVPCAVSVGCMFFTDRGMYCPQHQPKESHPMQLSSLSVRRRVYIARDEHTQVGDVIHEEERSNVVRIGTVCLHNLGQLLPHQLESGHFHNRRFIYPVGYRSTRIYWSMRVPRRRAMYICEILESNGYPLFRVTVVEPNRENESFEDTSCARVWQTILSRIEALRVESKLVRLFSQHLKGEDLYGLSEPHIVRAVESLPGVDCLRDYVFNFGRMELIAEMPLAINPSGCARSEPKLQTYVKRFSSSTHGGCSSSSGVRNALPGFPRSVHPGLTTTPTEYSKQYQSSRSQQYRRLKSEAAGNVILGRSRIQGLGLFAARTLEPQTMVIEYIGELIRLELANKREKEYEAHNRGIYMFRLDEDTVIDATMCGGLARYINHSCQPNCFAEHLNFGDTAHIVIITNRHIDKGEELCYDYNFDLEDGGSKIPCLCRAPNCRKWMN